MKLLIDENISHRILKLVNDNFPRSKHATAIRKRITDLEIWNYAKENGFVIVTYDEDFHEWQQLRGYLPRIVWLRIGNTSTKRIAQVLNSNKGKIKEMITRKNIGMLEIH
jgi:predicted nuclease of predicted toxin-antitoxin system